MRRSILVIAVYGCAIGCFDPHYDNGRVLCATSGAACPQGYHCASDGACWKNGQDPVSSNDMGSGGMCASDGDCNMPPNLICYSPTGNCSAGACTYTPKSTCSNGDCCADVHGSCDPSYNITCDSGFGNCDAQVSTGCESDLTNASATSSANADAERKRRGATRIRMRMPSLSTNRVRIFLLTMGCFWFPPP